jgi:hypothetical protein
VANPIDNIQPPPNPAGAGNTRAVSHGAHSEPAVRHAATVQKRRLLRQVGLRAADLDGAGLAYLDNWARAQAKVELMDAYANEHGWIDPEGKPPAFAAFYFTALNAARRALDGFVKYLKERGKGEPSMVVELAARRRP